MNNFIEAREFGWTDSSDSDTSGELFKEELESDLFSIDEDETPFSRHGPVVMPDLVDVTIQRDFWRSCTIGFILYYRKFSMHHLQHIISSAWRIRGTISMVG